MDNNTVRKQRLPQRLSAKKMLWMLLCQGAVIAPHITRLPVWLLIFSILMATSSYLITTRQWRLPPRTILFMLVLGSCAGIFISYGTLLGRDAGVGLLILMLSLKLLELRTRRDVMVFVFLGYFLVITNFLYTQSIPIALYMLVVSLWLTSTLVMIAHPGPELRARKNLRLAGALLLQSVPLMLVLFILFPRLPEPLWRLPEDSNTAISGLSDTMQPGSISKLSKSNAVAFRVDFKEQPPPMAQMYWRGPVLWNYNGSTWRGFNLYFERHPVSTIQPESRVDYTITLEPHNRKWLFALDLPATTPENTYINPDNSLVSRGDIRERYLYSVTSYTRYRTGLVLSPLESKQALQLPPEINPLTRAWATQLYNQYDTNEERVDAVLKYFREQDFVYTLTPPMLGTDAMDEFLFKTRQGFCEHYASSFVYVLRAMGIPARIVLGYQGGEYNQVGKYLIVRQSDAHAWAEAWFKEKGWIRIDPTAAVSPERVERGIEAALPDSLAIYDLGRSRNLVLRNLALYWDSFNYKWHRWVLGYDNARQHDFLASLGIDNYDWLSVATSILLAVLLALVPIAIWILRNRIAPHRDRASRLYAEFCARLARIGLVRLPHEGPGDFAARVSRKRPDLAEPVATLTRSYIDIRYGKKPGSDLLRELKKEVRNFRPARTR